MKKLNKYLEDLYVETLFSDNYDEAFLTTLNPKNRSQLIDSILYDNTNVFSKKQTNTIRRIIKTTELRAVVRNLRIDKILYGN